MQKLLLFLLLLLVIYLVRRALNRSENGTPRSARTAQPKPVELMRSCAHCGVLVPQSEGIESRKLFYCSDEHARLGAPDRRE